MPADWSLIAEKTFTPDDLLEIIGVFDMPEDHDTLWVRITQLNGEATSPWSYGILSWISADGHELGSVKAYGKGESEVYKLGVGLPPRERGGSITFTPRGFNLGWIRNGFPWPLRFEAFSGISGGIGQQLEGGTTLFVPSVPELPEANTQPDFSIEDAFAYLIFNFLLK